jgi:hypothetical protein
MLPSNPNLVTKPRNRFFNRLKSTKVRIFLLVLSVLLIGAGIVSFFFIQNSHKDVAKAASCTWTGNNSGDFSDSGNWDGCGGVPQNGDDVTFPASANTYSLNNDISGLSLNAVYVEALNSSAYTLSGNTLDVTYGITTATGSNDFIFNTNVTTCRTEGNGAITINSGVTYYSGCDGYFSYAFSGDINGSGTFVKNNYYNLDLSSDVDAILVLDRGSTTVPGGGSLNTTNQVSLNNGSVLWVLGGPSSFLNYPIEVNDGSFQHLTNQPVEVYGLNFYTGSLSEYYSWGNTYTNVSGSDLDLTNATYQMGYWGNTVGQTTTILQTTNGHTISGEFANWPSGTTRSFSSYSNTIEATIQYNSNSVVITMTGFVAGDCTWTGNNGQYWSDAGNWSGCSGSVPVNGKTIRIPSSSNEYNMVNDISGLSLTYLIVSPLNDNDYTLSGDSLTFNGSMDFGLGNNYFIFGTDVTAYALNYSGKISLNSGVTMYLSGGTGDYTFSGEINGSGTINRTSTGIQTFNNVYVGSNTSINSNSAFLRFTGNSSMDGDLYSNSGGILYAENSQITTNNLYGNGGDINIYPPSGGFQPYFNNGSLSGGLYAVDSNSPSDVGAGNFNNIGNLSSTNFRIRFFNTYSVGDQFTVLTSNSSITSEFANLPSSGTVIMEGWGGGIINSNVEISATYNTNSIVVTIVDIVPLTCRGNIVYTNTSGTISSGINNYTANSNCSWVIAPTNGASVTLNFTAFDTESGNDEVKVYDGTSTTGTLLGTFSGNSIPGSVTANSGSMLVVFTSNATTQAVGFTSNWTSTQLPGPSISSLGTTSGPVSGGTSVTVNGSNFVSGQYQDISTIGSTGSDGIRGMVVDSSGNQFVTGGFSGSITLGGTTLTSAGAEDVYVAKINPDHTYAWAIRAGGSGIDGFDRRQSMAIDTVDNTLVIAGFFGGSATFGSTYLPGFGASGSNAFIAKLNQSNGSFVWAKQAGTSTSDVYDSSIFPVQFGGSVDIDGSGNIYFSGRVWGTVGSTATFGGINKTLLNGADPFIAKMDSSGNFVWVKNYGDSNSGGLAHGLKVNSSGDVYATISFQNSLTIGSTTLTSYASNASSNVATIKLDTSGNEIWAVNSGAYTQTNGNSDLPYDVGLDSSENVYITGYFGAVEGKFGSIVVSGSSVGGSTVYTAKLNPSGTFLWAKGLPSPGFATARTMYIDSNDKIWIAGGYDNILTDGTQTITGNSTNAFFAQYDTSGNLVELKGISGTGGQLAVTGVGGNQVRALAVYNGNLYIAGEYFTTIGIGGQTITSAGNQDGFFTTWVIDKTSVKIGGIEVIANYISPTQLTFTTPADTKGFKDVIVTNSDGRSFNATGSFEYIAPGILNSNISSMTCSPSSTAVSTTVNCSITTNVDVSLLSGSVNVRIGASGTPTNCPVGTSGTTITCNNVGVGASTGTFASQYNASGSGTTYLNGNNITVTANSNPAIQNTDISSMTCSPSSTAVNTTVNCNITTSVDLNTLSGSVNVRIGASGTPTNCPVTGSGTTLTCNNVAVGASTGTFASQYNASGSGSTYANGNDTTVTASSNPAIQNSDISSMTCSPSSTAIATTVNCVITTAVNLNTLSGSVNVRIGTGGNIINCPVTGSGTSLTCNNIPVGVVVGGFYSQYAASGSGSSYNNGNQITVTSTGTCSVNTSGVGNGASTTFAGLCVNTGSLTLYPGDATADNDLCATGDTGTYQFVKDDGSLNDPVTCGTNEQTVTYQAINVSASRQTINTTINDILFEDLTGSNLNSYSVSATFGNFVNGGSGRNIALGANPDGAGDETQIDADAPGSANAGKLYCTINPQAVGSKVTGINPGSARQSGNLQKLVKGSKTTITSNSDSVNLFSTGGEQAVPGRYDIDGVTSKCRVPAYSDNGNYSQTIYFTVVAS